MATVKGLIEFTDEEIKRAGEIARDEPDEKRRERYRRGQLEMMAYNLRAARGDFDSY